VGIITQTITFYLSCHYYQKQEIATCRWKSDNGMIILFGLVVILWSAEHTALYLAIDNPGSQSDDPKQEFIGSVV
jgi:hypothetical protein